MEKQQLQENLLLDTLTVLGLSKQQIAIAKEAVTQIAGDNEQLYATVNDLCKSKHELETIKNQLAGLNSLIAPAATQTKRKYERKSVAKALDQAPMSKDIERKIVPSAPTDPMTGGVVLNPEEKAIQHEIDM